MGRQFGRIGGEREASAKRRAKGLQQTDISITCATRFGTRRRAVRSGVGSAGKASQSSERATERMDERMKERTKGGTRSGGNLHLAPIYQRANPREPLADWPAPLLGCATGRSRARPCFENTRRASARPAARQTPPIDRPLFRASGGSARAASLAPLPPPPPPPVSGSRRFRRAAESESSKTDARVGRSRRRR